jgi:SHS2 domain-containing protein
MYHLMAGLDMLVSITWQTIRLEAWDRETLLVDWLNELLFRTEMDGLLFVDFYIESLHDSGAASMVAHVGGVQGTASRAHIKAATFHDLSVVQDELGWSTLITFDV